MLAEILGSSSVEDALSPDILGPNPPPYRGMNHGSSGNDEVGDNNASTHKYGIALLGTLASVSLCAPPPPWVVFPELLCG